MKDLEAYLCSGGKSGDRTGLYDKPDKSGSGKKRTVVSKQMDSAAFVMLANSIAHFA